MQPADFILPDDEERFQYAIDMAGKYCNVAHIFYMLPEYTSWPLLCYIQYGRQHR